MLLHNEIQYTPSDTKNLETIKFGELEESVITMNYVFFSKKYMYNIHPCFIIFSLGTELNNLQRRPVPVAVRSKA